MQIRLNYKPADQPLQSWVFDPDELDNLQAEAIEVVGGDMWDSYGQWWLLLIRGNTRAIRALLWTCCNATDLNWTSTRLGSLPARLVWRMLRMGRRWEKTGQTNPIQVRHLPRRTRQWPPRTRPMDNQRT